MLEAMRQMIEDSDLCVLATTGQEGPHCSLMAYLADLEHDRLFLLTSKNTRKYQNLQKQPLVSLLIDDREYTDSSSREQVCSLIIKGKVSVLAQGPDKDAVMARFAVERPHLQPILSDPAVELLAVGIRSLQLLDGVRDAQYVEIN
ncbi:MAG: pyridoxamine 5'-phosphate oxidase family protein [Desulfarculaceae bacterium]|jgi:nitroimidazol reductase NimA-like FMN-containing flavoprotein (pyridoxamine 5'-phosphate oxidase superfamily)